MDTEPKLIIILAAGRSGSKYLRDLLGASRDCLTVPYDVNFVWRYGNESATDDVLNPESLSEAQRTWIRRRILRLAGWRPGSRRIIIEKSVPNALRVPFVRRVFPEAKFIHLVRDGRAVVESAQRVWNERPTIRYLIQKIRTLSPANFGYALSYLRNLTRSKNSAQTTKTWGPCYPGMKTDLEDLPLLEVCARQWSECIGSASAALTELPESDWIEVRYEDLVVREDTLEPLFEFVGLTDTESVRSAWQMRTNAGNADKWRHSLEAASIDRLNLLLHADLERLGYTETPARE